MIEITGFETAIGRCEIGWSERGVVRVRLAGSRPADADADPPPGIRRAIDGIVSLLAGGPAKLESVDVDLEACESFDRRVYALTRAIPAGETRTYGELARRLGEPDARAVGAALARNPVPIIVPCHRVIAADGGLRGFSAPGGIETKRRLLEIEGACAVGAQTLFELR
jgi:methylated-DNA-[protein]-cysteine S-methyltransferase